MEVVLPWQYYMAEICVTKSLLLQELIQALVSENNYSYNIIVQFY